MNFRIVLHGELGKGVAVGVFNKQELAALSAALNDGLCLVGVQKHGVLVAAGQVFPLVDAVRLILTVVVGHTSIQQHRHQQDQQYAENAQLPVRAFRRHKETGQAKGI